MTFPGVSRHGRHFANVGDGIIYLDLVVARTVEVMTVKNFPQKIKWKKNIPQHQSKYAILKFIIDCQSATKCQQFRLVTHSRPLQAPPIK